MEVGTSKTCPVDRLELDRHMSGNTVTLVLWLVKYSYHLQKCFCKRCDPAPKENIVTNVLEHAAESHVIPK